MKLERCSGVLLHPTSLPGPQGIGGFGPEAYAFVDFLDRSGQTLWQVLPLGPTSYGDSPYQSFSTHAGNPYLLSLRGMVEQGLLDPAELEGAPEMPDDRVDYKQVYEWKLPLLNRAARTFGQRGTAAQKADLEAFCREAGWWLDDYALFMALKDAFGWTAWNQWDPDLRSRKPQALEATREQHAEAIRTHQFIQWVFDRQWGALKKYANDRGIHVVGDIPIFVAMDSADAWVNADLFYFDKDKQPTVVAGVPPDYFAETGQLWGNPLYRWKKMKKDGYRWWLDRIRSALQKYDALRIDHFRGFAAYWEVPAGEKTAVKGRWVDGPGADFFITLKKELGDLPIVAEDLGDITPDVLELRDEFHLPGMRVLQFAFGGGPDNLFLPHNYTENSVVYTGTHDNDTSRGWYQESSKEHERDHFRRYTGSDGTNVAWTMIRTVLASIARYAVVPLQDVLDEGSHARMNLPGRASGNWQWRYRASDLGALPETRLLELTRLYGRERQAPSETTDRPPGA